MSGNNGQKFIECMQNGQSRLAGASENLRQISAVLSEFGQAIEAFSKGRVGIACVTREGHEPIAGDFAVGVPMSVVLVSHVAPETPRPIVADLEISQFGYPAMFVFNGSRQLALSRDAVSRLLGRLAESSVFASALHDLMLVGSHASRYQS